MRTRGSGGGSLQRLSYSCWLLTYPLAGRLGATAGLRSAVLALGAVAPAAALLAVRLWPAREPAPVEHEHAGLPAGHPHLADARRVGGGRQHSHRPLPDGLHTHR